MSARRSRYEPGSPELGRLLTRCRRRLEKLAGEKRRARGDRADKILREMLGVVAVSRKALSQAYRVRYVSPQV